MLLTAVFRCLGTVAYFQSQSAVPEMTSFRRKFHVALSVQGVVFLFLGK